MAAAGRTAAEVGDYPYQGETWSSPTLASGGTPSSPDWRSAITQAIAGMGGGGGGAGYGIGAGGQAPAHVGYEQQVPQVGKLPFALTPAQTEIARRAGNVLAALGMAASGPRGGSQGSGG